MKILFVDLDSTVVKHGTQEELRPGVFDKVRELTSTHAVFFFSCWSFTTRDVEFLQRTFPGAKGYIHKPLGESYGFFDDKLDMDMVGTEIPT